MASNNLRIVYKNIVDLPTTTITASSTFGAAFPTSNLQKDTKSATWKSGVASVASKVNLLISTAAVSEPINSIIMTLTNLSSAATIRVLGYNTLPVLSGTVDSPQINGTALGTPDFDTGVTPFVPYSTDVLTNDWSSYGYNAANYGMDKVTARVWLATPIPANMYIILQIADGNNTFIEASRLILGKYWSPTFNTGYGISKTLVDSSVNERTESGDLITRPGYVTSKVSFDLSWLTDTDRVQFMKLMRINGRRRGTFISLFPENVGNYEKEKEYQIYGKLSDLSAMTHPVLDMYSSTIEIEEI